MPNKPKSLNQFFQGKVLVMGRYEWINHGDYPQDQFFTNAYKWLAGKRKSKNIRIASFVSEVGSDIEKVSPSKLSNTNFDVYTVDASLVKSLDDVNAILDWVRQGGSLITGGQAWSWYYYQRKSDQENYANSYPGSKWVSTKL